MKCGKRVYPNQITADNKISRAWSGQDDWAGKPLPVRSYSCNFCNAWHITSKPLRSRLEQATLALEKVNE
jgi:hypothetical protein